MKHFQPFSKNALMPRENQQVLRLRLVYFKPRLLLAPLIFALSIPVQAGIPSKFEGSEGSSRWAQISKNFALNTEEVERRQDKLIFYVERRATKDDLN